MAEQTQTKEYLKNPFNYVGAKRKLLPQIFDIIPIDNIDTFVDMFGGSGEVSLNVPCRKVIYNDKNFRMVNILKNLDEGFVAEVDAYIERFNLSKDCKKEYGELRDLYNSLPGFADRQHAIMLYTLIAHSFNNQMGFNRYGEFNIPQGKNRSSFNDSMRKNLEEYIKAIKDKNIIFHSCDFDKINWDNVDAEKMFFYADPPYLITTGSYERDFLCRWSEEKERKLYEVLDKLDSLGCKFALSNVLSHKGKHNDILDEWSKKYNVHHLEMTYKACNYQTHKSKDKTSDEVLVTNF